MLEDLGKEGFMDTKLEDEAGIRGLFCLPSFHTCFFTLPSPPEWKRKLSCAYTSFASPLLRGKGSVECSILINTPAYSVSSSFHSFNHLHAIFQLRELGAGFPASLTLSMENVYERTL